MAGKDYGPKGCCGPAAFAMLAAAGGVLCLMVWLISQAVS